MRHGPVMTNLRRIALMCGAILLLGACAYADPNTQYPDNNAKSNRVGAGNAYTDRGSIFGQGGIFGADEGELPQDGSGGGIGVNSYLWRASLVTISFMPLASADPFGGVIITDWYTPPETQSERFKITVYILGRDLRADGVRATVFRQRQDTTGNWVDSAVEQKTTIDLENAILTRARQLRVAGLE